MKKTLLLLSVLLSFQSFSQIGANSTVYFKNQLFYADQNINLASSFNWRLPVGNNSVFTKYFQIGEGFLINGASNGVVTFTNFHPIFYTEYISLSQFEKPVQKTTAKTNNPNEGGYDGPPPPPPLIPYFKLNTTIDGEFTRQLKLIFVSEATDGVDKDIDTNMNEDLSDDIAFWIENGDYVIQGLNFNLSKKIPLSVKAAVSRKFKFYISETDGIDDAQPIYIYDALDRSYHNIRNTPYEAVVDSGKDTERFKITFTQETLVTNNAVRSNFFISQDNKNQVLNATNLNNAIMKSFKLYNILGKVVISKDNLGAEQYFSFPTSGLSAGIYIATFTTADSEKITRKVIISNSGY
ncbi:T9SS type A sorting domain-containing protein [Flavobacterium defluvii]|uniref:Por secretion system C-terminal sorting domain-containing protein n=1 Tax=Flavobacterium defluvii TaxID=370979 RepID=A0A1M5WN84_9FLAO|nr:T9SS type A sorting domain-containing protein [Flavobacterium defluvii]SHH88997.1 Por secretion system C-terminal sorting domain-containing protein [Flavobacterium defluvii]